MHPMLSYKLLECYFKNLSASTRPQLIITTHESNLLDLELLRSDEIWFVEKDKTGASRLTSLAEYKPRSDVRKGYLQGRYGAVPFFASVPELKCR
jgi:AAA15 family ATPase/GTPase